MRESDYREWMVSVTERCEDRKNMDRLMDELNNALNEDPDNPEILFYIGYLLLKGEHHGFAYHVLKRVVDLAPDKGEAWNNLARSMLPRSGLIDTLEVLQTAAALEPESTAVLLNTSVAYLNLGHPGMAEKAARKALEIAPSNKSRENLGVSLIAQRKWREGFRYHDASLGGPNRDRHRYGNAPDWDGDEQIDGDIVIYGEQGLGDEVMLASCIPDAIKETDGNNLILNVDHRLANLFRRSFPQVQAVYGDRHRFPNIRWDKHHKITAQAALGQLQTFYRKTDADFPGKPYLIPDPDRMAAYGGLIQRISPDGEPIVGIAWQGGKPHAAERSERSLELEDFLPLIDPEKSGIYAHWFVLEYVDVNKEVDDFKRAHPELASRVHYFPWILRSSDYDDTAALTALLDSVVTVPTTILHLAGALGIDCHVLLPIVPHWRFGYDPAWKDFPWHKSVHLFRRESGEHKALAIERFVKEQGQSIGRQFSPFFNGQVAEAGQSK